MSSGISLGFQCIQRTNLLTVMTEMPLSARKEAKAYLLYSQYEVNVTRNRVCAEDVTYTHNSSNTANKGSLKALSGV